MASVKVAVRVRPFNKRELAMGARLVVQMDGKRTRIYNTNKPSGSCREIDSEHFKDFTFDHSYWSFDDSHESFASQEEVFYDLGTEVVESAFEGYNACVFAYGQTGSGKTHTMMGSPESQGLIPRICKTLFARMAAGKESGASYRTEVSFLEIHNERVRDLLRPEEPRTPTASHSLKVREHPKRGPYVQDLSSHLVYDYSDIQECMVRGNTHRTTASTNMNDVSSRSHAIFTITFVQAGFSENNMPSETVSKVHLVDLAGSERANATGATGQRLKEGAHINKSLVTLGSVISALAELSSSTIDSNGSQTHSYQQHQRRSVFIPYRDSVLTWLLKDSLGGNSKTIMIAAISPADCNYGETLSTLRYANRAKNIINKPTINEDPNVKLIKELRDEIEKLKSLIGNKDLSVEKPQVLLAQIHEKQEQEKVLTEEWAEKWRETQKILQEQRALGLRKSGVGVVLDSEMPHLVGIDDDLLSTGVTLYHLKEGKTMVGTDNASSTPDIVLTGADVEPEHCILELENGVVTLYPLSGHCWINTAQVDKATRLSQGCIILLGRNNMFRYNDPVEAAKLRKEGGLGNGNLQSTVVNLSRMSLLSWSVSDLHVSSSSDNLLNSSEDLRALEELEQQKAALVREKEEFKREQEEREERWAARRRALEEAQKELEREWGAQWREWAEGIAALEKRQRELRARRKSLEQERRNEMTQVENLCREVVSLRNDLQIKHRQFQEFVTNHNRLQSHCPEQTDESTENESSPGSSWSNSKATETFKKLSQRRVAELESELQLKLKNLKERQNKMDAMDEELVILGEKQKEIDQLEKERETDNRLHLAARSTEKMEEILRRKRSLSLNLQRAFLPASPEQSLMSSDDMITCTDDWPSEEHLGNRKKNITRVLHLIYPEISSNSEIADTFHTAVADSPEQHFPIIASNDNSITHHSLLSYEAKNFETPLKRDDIVIKDDSDYLDFKTSVDVEVREFPDDSNLSENCLDSDRRTNDDNHDNYIVEHSDYIDATYKSWVSKSPAMKKLNEKIAQQRCTVLKCLEASPAMKDELNHQIFILQDLQRQQIELEVALLGEKNNHLYEDPLVPSVDNEIPKQKSLGECHSPGNNSSDKEHMNGHNSRASITSSTISLSNSAVNVNSPKSQSSNDEDGVSSSHPRPRNGELSIYSSGYQREDRLNSPHALTITRSLPTLVGNGANNEAVVNMVISVTSYIIRGAGTSSHYEYEVRIVCSDDSWTLLRRFRRFRELYVSMKEKYGSKVSNIRFPPRQIFSFAKYELVARQRRKRLEEYLRKLILVCSEIPNCEPLYKFKDDLNKIDKQSLLEFSSFFRKGTFESSKYGTS